jgi:pilus assembly protein FimV
MVRKKLATVVAALSTLQAGLVSALGMGELSLQSALNQPLAAEINILNTGDLDPAQVLVALASPKDFQNAGVSRDFFLTNIKFSVELDGNGKGVIKVSSRQPVVEPYLNFLVETRWPSGRLLREYTVLLDLPVFSESQAKRVQAAKAGPEPVRQARPRPAPRQQEPVAIAAPQRQSGGGSDRVGGELEPGGEYRVGNDDTLWVIASKARPSRQFSVQQTMVGIQRLNPSAFARGNINRLKAGSVLRLPTEGELTEVSRGDAIEEVANQNSSWRRGTDGQVASSNKAQLDATAGRADDGERFREQDRLSIAGAGSSQNDQVGDGEGASSAGNRALRNQLAQSQESLDKTALEKGELQSRLDGVEAKLATLQRLLELKDNQLAAMQGTQAQAEDAAAAAPVAPAADPAMADLKTLAEDDSAQQDSAPGEKAPDAGDMAPDADMPADDDQQAEALAQTPMADTPADQSSGQPTDTQPPAQPVPVPEEPGLVGQLLGSPLVLGGAGLLVLAGVVVAVLRRRREQEDEFSLEEESLDELADVSFDEGDFLESSDSELSFSEPEPEVADQLAAELEQEIAADNAAEVAAAELIAEEQVEQLQPETGDAIAEADIYVAYGRYQQAVDLLRTAINQEPGRSDLQVKLLEVYIETRDKPGFQQQYVQLAALGDDAAVGEVKEMLSTVDGVADWLDDLPGAAAVGEFSDADMDAELIEGEESGLALDEELTLDFEDEQPIESLDSEASEFDSFDLDLDLELDEDTDTSAQAELASTANDEGDELGDISLDLEDSSELGDFSLELDDSADLSLDADESLNDIAEQVTEADDGFDLDLDNDGDFDLDFADLAENTDLGDLASEFGDTSESKVLPDDASDSADDLSFDLDLSEEIDIEDDSGALGDNDSTQGFALPDKMPMAGSGASDESFDESVANGEAGGEEFDFLSDTDEVATKLDLARAYIDMGDTDGAKDILDEVRQEGSDEQKNEADSLIERIE